MRPLSHIRAFVRLRSFRAGVSRPRLCIARIACKRHTDCPDHKMVDAWVLGAVLCAIPLLLLGIAFALTPTASDLKLSAMPPAAWIYVQAIKSALTKGNDHARALKRVRRIQVRGSESARAQHARRTQDRRHSPRHVQRSITNWQHDCTYIKNTYTDTLMSPSPATQVLERPTCVCVCVCVCTCVCMCVCV